MILNPYNTIFGTKSPVSRDSEPEPEISPLKQLKDRSYQIKCRLKEALEARKEMDEVYSKGYFENHYPKADKRIKELLNERARLAISRMANYEQEEDKEEKENKGISLTIKIGGDN